MKKLKSVVMQEESFLGAGCTTRFEIRAKCEGRFLQNDISKIHAHKSAKKHAANIGHPPKNNKRFYPT
ncbi:MAG: hypothetical protein AAB354_08960, partial [candidate division KSB1 bacterium]